MQRHVIHSALLASLLAMSSAAWSQCDTVEQSDATMVQVEQELKARMAREKTANDAVMTELDARAATLKWTREQISSFKNELAAADFLSDRQDRRSLESERLNRISRQLIADAGGGDRKALCRLMIQYRAPSAAIDRIVEEQVAAMRRKVAQMK